MIESIRGSISPEHLGKTYIHEHLCLDLSAHKKDPDTNYNAKEIVTKEMMNLKHKGISTIVEVTNRGMGRNIELMSEIAEQTDLNIILSTGFYKEPFLPEYVYKMTEEELVKMLVKDIQEGIDGTKFKAHVIGEIGTSKNQMTEMERKVFNVAAKTHLETGHPISTHTTLGTYGIEQIELLKAFGVNLEQVVIGHLDLNCNLEYHLQIAREGCFLAFDTIGKMNYEKDEVRARQIKALIDNGHLDQIVLSEDLTRKSHLKENGGIGYDYLIDRFIPMMKLEDITEEQIDRMLINNPRRFLTIQ